MALRHVVLFRIHDHVPDADVDLAVERLRALGTLPGIRRWRVERSLDTRKGRIVIEDATFDEAAVFQEFRSTPAHLEAGQLMAGIADWWVADYTE